MNNTRIKTDIKENIVKLDSRSHTSVGCAWYQPLHQINQARADSWQSEQTVQNRCIRSDRAFSRLAFGRVHRDFESKEPSKVGARLRGDIRRGDQQGCVTADLALSRKHAPCDTAGCLTVAVVQSRA